MNNYFPKINRVASVPEPGLWRSKQGPNKRRSSGEIFRRKIRQKLCKLIGIFWVLFWLVSLLVTKIIPVSYLKVSFLFHTRYLSVFLCFGFPVSPSVCLILFLYASLWVFMSVLWSVIIYFTVTLSFLCFVHWYKTFHHFVMCFGGL